MRENGKLERITHILASVEWYYVHPMRNMYHSKPVEVWANHFESDVPSHAFYDPVARTQCNCISVPHQVPLISYQMEKLK